MASRLVGFRVLFLGTFHGLSLMIFALEVCDLDFALDEMSSVFLVDAVALQLKKIFSKYYTL